MSRPAVFLDRDGTIIKDSGYIAEPAKVQLLPGAAEGIRRLSDAGFTVVVVSNQSGIARGLFDEAALMQVHQRMEHALSEAGAKLDGAYYCPFLPGPEAANEKYRRDSELRKPQPGMLLQAQKDFGLELARSWMIGNSPADIQAGAAAGCRTIIIADPNIAPPEAAGTADFVAADLLEAAEFITKSAVSAMPQPPTSTDPPAGERTTPPPDDPMETRETAQILRRIHDQLERANRRSRQHDFSILRLFGALLQMFAIVVGLWGLLALTGDRHDAATARLALACLLQLASMAAFAHDYLR